MAYVLIIYIANAGVSQHTYADKEACFYAAELFMRQQKLLSPLREAICVPQSAPAQQETRTDD